jgi:hypothetical protein
VLITNAAGGDKKGELTLSLSTFSIRSSVMVSRALLTRLFIASPVNKNRSLSSSPIRMRKNRTKLWGEEDLQVEKAVLAPPDHFLGVKNQACDKNASKGATSHTFASNRGSM